MLNIDFYRPNYDMDVKELVDRWRPHHPVLYS